MVFMDWVLISVLPFLWFYHKVDICFREINVAKYVTLLIHTYNDLMILVLIYYQIRYTLTLDLVNIYNHKKGITEIRT